jgi:hypothetical protein
MVALVVAPAGGRLDDQGKQADQQLLWLKAAQRHAPLMS